MHSGIHQVLMNSPKRRNANSVQQLGVEKEGDGWWLGGGRDGLERAIIAMMNESVGRGPRAITHSLRQAVSGPQLHYGDAVPSADFFFPSSARSATGLGDRKHHFDRSGVGGLPQIQSGRGSLPL